METTLLWETNSSSCSRRDSGICALTCADRFSLFTMIKKTPRGTRPALHLGGKSASQGGGGRRDRLRRKSCGSREVQFLNALHRAKPDAVSYTHLRAHETPEHLVCRL